MYLNRSNLPPLSSLLPFEAAARLESITEAADELNLSQAAVSKQIKALEQYLGAALFERRNRAIYLTQEARDLQEVIRTSLGDIALASKNIRDKHSDAEIVLRSQQCEALYWLMPRLSRFYQKHPEIELRVGVSTKPLSEVGEGFDIALQSIDRSNNSAKLVHCVSDEIFPVCSPQYISADSKALSVEQLANCRLLHHQALRQDWMTWDQWLEKRGITSRDSKSDLIFDSYPMVMQATVEGHGIAIGWRRTCENLLKTGALISPCAETETIPDDLGLFVPYDRQLGRNAKILLAWLIAEFD